MVKVSAHQVNFRMSTEEYGWAIRHAEKLGTTISDILRRSLSVYKESVIEQDEQRKANSEIVDMLGRPILICKNEDCEDMVEIDWALVEQASKNLNGDGFKSWMFFERQNIGSNVYLNKSIIGNGKGVRELMDKGYLYKDKDGNLVFQDEI